jgi:hypothetical protein
MPKYRVLEKSFINNTLFGPGEPAGDIVDYDGEPGKALKLIQSDSQPEQEDGEPEQLA